VVELSISIEGVFGLDWSAWKRLVRTVENLGFTSLYLSDHFVMLEPPDYPSLEMIVAFTYLADHTERVRFGPMVAPLSFRDPVMLARQAAALDELSDGRMVLGVGAGWLAREHAMFGYELGDKRTRLDRMAEGVEVIARLLRADEPVDFEGRFFRLQAAMLPPPRRLGRPPIMIGGSGPKRTLPLVARFADAWNAQVLGPEQIRQRNALLDQLLLQADRRPEDVRRTLNVPVLCWRTPEELETRQSRQVPFPPWKHFSVEEHLEKLRAWPALVGTPEEIVQQIRTFEAAGISEISMQWLAPNDIEGLEILAAEVLPYVTAAAA
jgi:alkanesulfonate monooxygenase SsuD/methylene tetrahydromethanopterin reductase-like flavin-dependent oxidoreductase (luciferase family)